MFETNPANCPAASVIGHATAKKVAHNHRQKARRKAKGGKPQRGRKKKG